MSTIPIEQQILAVENVINGGEPDKTTLASVVLTLGVFAQDPEAYRAYAKKLREAKKQPAVAELLDEFPDAYIAEIND